MKTPKVSVIMSVYKETIEQLEKSMNSILHQTFQDFEFILVLDNPDNLKAKNYILELQKGDGRIIFLENEENMKLGASLNKGIKIAQGKYIARMDGDDIYYIHKLQKQVAYLENNNKIDLLFTGWQEIYQGGNITTRIPSKEDFKNISKTFFYKSPLLHASMMCREEIFEKYLYPETDMPEDFGLFIQLISGGYNFDILEEVLYTYRKEHENIDIKYKKIRIFSSNLIKILYKNTRAYWNNFYFWWMFFISVIQWLLSRNKYIFKYFFGFLQRVYKRVFI